MKTLTAAILAALTLSATPAMAAPPASSNDPFANYCVTRIQPNGREIILDVFDATGGLTQEQLIRQTAFQYANLQRTNNPSWRVVIYGPVDPPETYWTNDDRIWDSAVNLP